MRENESEIAGLTIYDKLQNKKKKKNETMIRISKHLGSNVSV